MVEEQRKETNLIEPSDTLMLIFNKTFLRNFAE